MFIKQLALLLGFLVIVVIALDGLSDLLIAGYKFAWLLPVVLLSAYVWLWVLLSKQKVRRSAFYVPVGILLASLIGYGSYGAYAKQQRSIPTVSEFDTSRYQPFSGSGYLARLDGPSSLQLTENLPKLDGSTALYPMYAAFVEAVYAKDALYKDWDVIQVSKTGHAYQRLLNKEVDIIFVPAPSKNQQQQADQLGLAFHLTPIGKEAFVFFVNKTNPVNNLTTSQIKKIYAAELTNWQAMGGENKEIRAFQRPEGSGSQTALQRIMGDTPLAQAPHENVVQGMGGIINQVADYRNFDNALGFSFLLYSTRMVKNDQIKLLDIDGVAPDQHHIRDNSYPFTYDLYAVTLGNESAETKALINWIQTAQGKELIEKTGYVTVP